MRKSDSKSVDFRSGSGGCPQSCPTGAESEGSVGWRLWSGTEQLAAVRHRFGCSGELKRISKILMRYEIVADVLKRNYQNMQLY